MPAQTRTGDNTDFVHMIRRMLKAAGERVAHDDPAVLAELVALRADLDRAVRVAVGAQRAAGITWASIGEATGTTGQAANMKWGGDH